MKKYKWTKSDIDKVTRLVKRYKKILHLGSWEVKLHFENGYPKHGDTIRGERFVAFATNTITAPYEKIEITFHSALLAEAGVNKGVLDSTVRHELCHCLTQEMFELTLERFVTEKDCLDAVERLTQRISQLI